jgi:hypothetical protein
MRKAGTGKAMIFLRLLPGKSVPGFGSVWEILLPSEVPGVVTKQELISLKNDPDVKTYKVL